MSLGPFCKVDSLSSYRVDLLFPYIAEAPSPASTSPHSLI